MKTKYIFECRNRDCAVNNGQVTYLVFSMAQVKKLFKEHSEALHHCQYYPLKNEVPQP